MSIKLDRLSHTFVEEISKILRTEIKNEQLKYVTITDAKISSDLSMAKVYFLVLNKKNIEEVRVSLNKAKGFIKAKLCENIDIRKMPDILFVYDESIEYANKIENIIENLKEDNHE